METLEKLEKEYMIFHYASKKIGTVSSQWVEQSFDLAALCAAMHSSAGIFHSLWRCGVSHLEIEDCYAVCLVVYVPSLVHLHRGKLLQLKINKT